MFLSIHLLSFPIICCTIRRHTYDERRLCDAQRIWPSRGIPRRAGNDATGAGTMAGAWTKAGAGTMAGTKAGTGTKAGAGTRTKAGTKAGTGAMAGAETRARTMAGILVVLPAFSALLVRVPRKPVSLRRLEPMMLISKDRPDLPADLFAFPAVTIVYAYHVLRVVPMF